MKKQTYKYIYIYIYYVYIFENRNETYVVIYSLQKYIVRSF